MIPELAYVMLACARIGAIHTVVFSGFSATSLRDRVEDSGSKIIITADGGFRKGKLIKLKEIVDESAPKPKVDKTKPKGDETKPVVDETKPVVDEGKPIVDDAPPEPPPKKTKAD